MIRSGDPWAGLDDFHRTVLDFIAGIQEQEAHARWTEFRRSSPTRRRSSSRSRRNWRRRPVRCRRDGRCRGRRGLLATACRAVGDALGIEVRAPQPDGDRTPADLAATRSGTWPEPPGFHVRPVTLREGWWRRAAASRCSAGS